jgi:hypothetical protein
VRPAILSAFIESGLRESLHFAAIGLTIAMTPVVVVPLW